MIKTFRHKGLRRFFEDDDGSRLPPDMLERIRLILSALHAAQEIEGMNVPTFRLHILKGELKGFFFSDCPRELADHFPVSRWRRFRRGAYRLPLKKAKTYGDEEPCTPR